MKRALLLVYVLALVASACGGEEDAEGRTGESPVDAGGSGYARPVCQVTLCDELPLMAGLPPSGRPARVLRRVTPDECRTRVVESFREGRPAAWLLAVLAAPAADRPVEVPDAWRPALAAAELSLEAADWLAARLDRTVPDWWTISAPISPGDLAADSSVTEIPAPYDTRESALETSGCGEMKLSMVLESVTVHERDDNFADDRVYCMVRARDARFEESVSTEISDYLGPEETYYFQDGVFYGRQAARDPGEQLHVLYDCWEHDSDADYDKFREVVEAAKRLGKALESTAPDVAGYLMTAAEVATLAIQIASALDGDDHLYHDEETLTRQGLWESMNQAPRRIVARDTHFGMNWAWELAVSARGCATGEPDTEPTPEACGPGNCDGCCVGNRCDTGTSTQSCGTGGVACHSCDAMEACGAGRCAFDAGVGLDVIVYSGTVSPTDEYGSCWDDIFGACDDPPDVYVEVSAGGQSGSTSISESWSPQWNQTILTSVPARDLMAAPSIAIWDDDLSNDDLICEGTLAFEEALLREGAARVDCGSIASVVLHFEAR